MNRERLADLMEIEIDTRWHKQTGGRLGRTDYLAIADRIIAEENQLQNKEPIFYDCTLAKFAEQMNVPLYKAMEFGKYFEKKYKVQEIHDKVYEILDYLKAKESR